MRIGAFPNPGDTASLLLISFYRWTKPVGGFSLQDRANPILGVFDGGTRIAVAGFIRDLLAFSSREVPIERLDFVGLVFILRIRRRRIVIENHMVHDEPVEVGSLEQAKAQAVSAGDALMAGFPKRSWRCSEL